MPAAGRLRGKEEGIAVAALNSHRCPRQRASLAFILERRLHRLSRMTDPQRSCYTMPGSARPATHEVCIPFALASVQEYER
jgi:hypothetical protein